MAATRRVDNEEYMAAMANARALRTTVAAQLYELVIESDRMSSREEVVEQIQNVGHTMQRLRQAQGVEQQARDTGLPVGPALAAQRELRQLLREAVMVLAVSCGGWAAAMDLEYGIPAD